jgi:hypothetical protein
MGARKPQVLNRITNIWYYVSLKYTFILFGLTSGIFNLFFRPHGSRELYYTEDFSTLKRAISFFLHLFIQVGPTPKK